MINPTLVVVFDVESVGRRVIRETIGEVAVGEPERIGGDRKLQVLRWGAAYYFQFWRELWFWR